MPELSDRLEGIVHADTQVHDDVVDLTAAEVYTVGNPGQVDFGGGELEPADLTPVPAGYRRPEDDYAWWTLGGGTYILEFNETLAAGDPVVLQTRNAVRERGAYHPTVRVTELGRVPLTVAAGGIRIKENARVSTLRPA